MNNVPKNTQPIMYVMLITFLIIMYSQLSAQTNHDTVSSVNQNKTVYSGIGQVYLHQNIQKNNRAQSHYLCSINVTFEHLFKNERIADQIFGSDTLFIQGSSVVNRNNNALIADYFGLSPSFSSTVQLKPIHYNVTVSTIIGTFLDVMLEGMYCYAVIPWSFEKSGIHMHEIIDAENRSTTFPAGNIINTHQTTRSPYTSFTDAVTYPKTTGNLQPLQNGLLKVKNRQGVGDIAWALGLQWVKTPIHKLTSEIHFTFPTSRHSKNKTVFEPTSGNGSQTVMGISSIWNTELYKNFESTVDLFVSCMLAHGFAKTEKRSFDFKQNGSLSRYIPLKEFNQGQATGNVIPAINVTTLSCKVSNDIIFEGICMFGIHYKNINGHIGYNGYIKSRDKIELQETVTPERYGIKGTQNLFNTSTNTIDNTTASRTTITTGSITDQASFSDPITTYIQTSDVSIHSARNPLTVIHRFFSALEYQQSITETVNSFYRIGTTISFNGHHDQNKKSVKNLQTACHWSLDANFGLKF